MTPEERAEKFKSETERLNAALGRFVVSFEELVAAMRGVISLHVGEVPPPYHVRQQKIAQIFTADLTADPLVRVFRSIILLTLESYKNQGQRPEIEKLLSNLCSRIDEINRIRNTFLHGTWFINYGHEEQTDFSLAKGIKQTNTAKGLRLDRLEHTVESFSKHIEECCTLRDLVTFFGGAMLYDEIDLLKNFGLREKKLVKLEVT